MAPKAFIQTYGCQMNEHDSQRMAALLAKEGYEISPELDGASLVIVNTCSVRHNPENKVYSQLGRLRGLKEANPDAIIGVGGCVAQQEGEAILKREKLVDMVFGPDNFFRLPEMIERVRGGERVLMTKWQPREQKVQNFVPEEWVDHGYVEGIKAYVSITKGCDNFCTFCVVPFTRGRLVCREPANILREVEAQVAGGALEVWLLGQNVNSYEIGPYGFYELLDDVSRIEGLERIRFTSPYPNDWDDRLSDLMASRANICNHLHLPFQSGSDRILDMMNRQHTREQYLEKVRYMQSINPGLELTTDIIVGFPTETDEEFEQTLQVLEEVRFSQIFPFKYSVRPKTAAQRKLEDDVPRTVKEERLARVIALQDRINAEKMASYLGSVQEVLIDGASTRERGVMNGRTGGHRPVAVRNDELEIGDMVQVRITSHSAHWLQGEVVHEAVAATA
jgi:tRNA-2-methylthio-N6-dimethylallyladenosine synthase